MTKDDLIFIAVEEGFTGDIDAIWERRPNEGIRKKMCFDMTIEEYLSRLFFSGKLGLANNIIAERAEANDRKSDTTQS